MREPLLAFATRAYRDRLPSLCAAGGFERAEVTVRTFPDGERYQRIERSVDGRDVAILGGTPTDEDTLEIFDLACGLVKYGARRLSLVVPYFGYSTMDRAMFGAREVVTAKSRARLFSAIPTAAYGNRIFLLDLHTEGLPHYFEGGLRPVHVYAAPLIKAAARRMGGDDFVLACTDAGRAKWVESLANDMGVHASFVFKRRLDARRTEVSAISAQVDDQVVVIYDDMIRTGGSLIEAARAYRHAGARQIFAIATHGVLPGDALERLYGCDLFESIVCTDSHPRARGLANDRPDFLQIESVAELLGEALRESP